MEQDKNEQDLDILEKSYSMLSNLWASGIHDYHNLTSAYLTANSILVAAIAIILLVGVITTYIVSIAFSIIGLIICLQMGIALGRFRAQNAYWERNLRIIESRPNWKRYPYFNELYKFRDKQKDYCKKEGKWYVLKENGEESAFEPYFSIKHHKDFWAPRMKGLPWIFSILYTFLLLWSIGNLIN